jgi:hypothetical protein
VLKATDVHLISVHFISVQFGWSVARGSPNLLSIPPIISFHFLSIHFSFQSCSPSHLGFFCTEPAARRVPRAVATVKRVLLLVHGSWFMVQGLVSQQDSVDQTTPSFALAIQHAVPGFRFRHDLPLQMLTARFEGRIRRSDTGSTSRTCTLRVYGSVCKDLGSKC